MKYVYNFIVNLKIKIKKMPPKPIDSAGYDFEMERIYCEISNNKAGIIGLQFPDGLKQYAIDIAGAIEKKTGARVIIFAQPAYGACDLREGEATSLGIDMIIHFGHNEMLPGKLDAEC